MDTTSVVVAVETEVRRMATKTEKKEEERRQSREEEMPQNKGTKYTSDEEKAR